ncbi:hypothetical protein [[Eubacterium] cellulosolvens]
MAVKLIFIFNRGHLIDRENLLIPDVLIDKYDIIPKNVLKSCFDLIWNSCGYPKSLNYDKSGELKPSDAEYPFMR